jgi:hypothetical protein
MLRWHPEATNDGEVTHGPLADKLDLGFVDIPVLEPLMRITLRGVWQGGEEMVAVIPPSSCI